MKNFAKGIPSEKAEINRKLSEANAKIVDLRRSSKTNENDSPEVKKDLSGILRHLESVRNNIMLQYEKIDQMEKEQVEFPQIKKNIYQDLDTFDNAFSKAGSIVKPGKFRTRERSVDFKNPYGNQ